MHSRGVEYDLLRAAPRTLHVDFCRGNRVAVSLADLVYCVRVRVSLLSQVTSNQGQRLPL